MTVEPPPVLSATRFVAFGDSITEGKRGGDYPSNLKTLLVQRYTAQAIEVDNAGRGGEWAVEGVSRLPGVLAQYAPQALLLQEGVNDLNWDGVAGIPSVVSALRTMIRQARGRGVLVFVGTLLPQWPAACVSGAPCRAWAPEVIAPANDQIRSMVTGEGAVLVDLYQALAVDPGLFLSNDGLHPSAAGYQAIADTFFTAIQTHLETPSAVSVPSARALQFRKR